jgi:hypothetical protein
LLEQSAHFDFLRNTVFLIHVPISSFSGHQNSLENVGNFLVLHFLAALSYPLYSAIGKHMDNTLLSW